MDALIHGANVLYLLSYLMRDILWLRVLTVVAAAFLIVFFYVRPDPLWTAIYWNVVFIALNLYWIVRLLLERRPVPMSAEEARLYRLAFRAMTPREMLRLLKIGNWEHHSKGKRLLRRGDAVPQLSVISSGTAGVEADGQTVSELAEGQFIGAMGFICEDPASSDVVATDAMRCLTWPSAKLRDFLNKNPDLRAGFQRTLSRELIGRLKSSWAHQG